jgi:hypothetical protein
MHLRTVILQLPRSAACVVHTLLEAVFGTNGFRDRTSSDGPAVNNSHALPISMCVTKCSALS